MSADGLRVDGRRWREVRKLQCRVGVKCGGIGSTDSVVDGSAYVELGNTRVLAVVSGPREMSLPLSQSQSQSGGGSQNLVVSYSLAPFSSSDRRVFRKSHPLLLEHSEILASIFLPLISPGSSLNRAQIIVNVQILQRDGGELAAAINAVSLALMDAGVPMADFAVACSAAHLGTSTSHAEASSDQPTDQPLHSKAILVDPNRAEDAHGLPTVIATLLPRSGRLALLSFEGARLPAANLQPVVEAALDGCAAIKSVLELEIRSATVHRSSLLI